MYLFAILLVVVVMIALLRMNNLSVGQIDEARQVNEDTETRFKRNDAWFSYSGNVNDVSDSGGYDGGDGFDGGSSDGGGDGSSGF